MAIEQYKFLKRSPLATLSVREISLAIQPIVAEVLQRHPNKENRENTLRNTNSNWYCFMDVKEVLNKTNSKGTIKDKRACDGYHACVSGMCSTQRT